MEYKIIVKNVGMGLTRKIDQASEDLAKEVNEYISRGGEPAGGVAMGVAGAGATPFLLQAMVRPMIRTAAPELSPPAPAHRG
jgi:hypothetical protein